MCKTVDTKKWLTWLYFINTIMIVMGLSLLGTSIWALASPSTTIFRAQYKPLIIGGLMVAIVMVIIAGIGFGGACRAERTQRNKKRHWCLSVYFVILSVLFCVQTGVMAASIVVHQKLHTVQATPYNPYQELVLDKQIVDKFLLTHPTVWKSIQDDFQCCGWGASDNSNPTKPALLKALVSGSGNRPTASEIAAATPNMKKPANASEIAAVVAEELAKVPAQPPPPAIATRYGRLETGDACGTVSSVPCRDALIAWVQDDLVWVIVFSILLIMIEVTAMISTICICCCAKIEDYGEALKAGKPSPHADYEKPYTSLPVN